MRDETEEDAADRVRDALSGCRLLRPSRPVLGGTGSVVRSRSGTRSLCVDSARVGEVSGAVSTSSALSSLGQPRSCRRAHVCAQDFFLLTVRFLDWQQRRACARGFRAAARASLEFVTGAANRTLYYRGSRTPAQPSAANRAVPSTVRLAQAPPASFLQARPAAHDKPIR